MMTRHIAGTFVAEILSQGYRHMTPLRSMVRPHALQNGDQKETKSITISIPVSRECLRIIFQISTIPKKSKETNKIIMIANYEYISVDLWNLLNTYKYINIGYRLP